MLLILQRKFLPHGMEHFEIINVPLHKKGDKTDSCNYREMSLLSTKCTIFKHFLLRLTTNIYDIIGDYEGEFRRTRSATDHIFGIRQIDIQSRIQRDNTSAVYRLQENL
jgi:hypothetical protein